MEVFFTTFLQLSSSPLFCSVQLLPYDLIAVPFFIRQRGPSMLEMKGSVYPSEITNCSTTGELNNRLL